MEFDSVPTGWSVRPIWSMFVREKNIGHPEETMLSVFREHGVVEKNSLKNLNVTAYNRNIYQLVDKGWLVVNRMKAWQGSVGISSYRGIVSGHYLCFRPVHEESSRYLNWLLRSAPYTADYSRLSRGVRPGQAEIDNDQLRVVQVLLPPLREQRRIADFLDDQVALLDRAIDLRREQQTLEEARQRSLIREVVAGGQHPEVEPPSDAPWIARLHRSAVVQPLGRTLTLQRGVDLTADEQREGPFPVVTTGGIRGSHDRAVATGPGVIIGRYGSVGSVFFVEGDYWPHNTTLYVKNFKGSSPRFTYYLLLAYPYERLQARAAVPGVNRNDMHADLMPWLPRAVQDECVKFLDEVLEERRRLQGAVDHSVRLLSERKQALITAAVTGQFDVTTARSVA